jgi:hypothetical protein
MKSVRFKAKGTQFIGQHKDHGSEYRQDLLQSTTEKGSQEICLHTLSCAVTVITNKIQNYLTMAY